MANCDADIKKHRCMSESNERFEDVVECLRVNFDELGWSPGLAQTLFILHLHFQIYWIFTKNIVSYCLIIINFWIEFKQSIKHRNARPQCLDGKKLKRLTIPLMTNLCDPANLTLASSVTIRRARFFFHIFKIIIKHWFMYLWTIPKVSNFLSKSFCQKIPNFSSDLRRTLSPLEESRRIVSAPSPKIFLATPLTNGNARGSEVRGALSGEGNYGAKLRWRGTHQKNFPQSCHCL